MCHEVSAGQRTTGPYGSHTGLHHSPYLSPHPELPWVSQPLGPYRQHHCTDTSSKDTNRNTPRLSHKLQAQMPASVLLLQVSGQQDWLADSGPGPRAEQP